MAEKLGDVGSDQMDTFKELGNIGAGNAATALAGILNMRITMTVPEVNIVPFNDIINILNGPENLVVGVLVNMDGDLTGYVLLILELQDAYEMASLALMDNRPIPATISPADFSDLDRNTLGEIANILVGSYLSAISAMTQLRVAPSVPQTAVDMVGAIISIVLIEYGNIGDSVLFLKTQFSDVDKKMAGHFFLIPDFESYQVLMHSLGIEL